MTLSPRRIVPALVALASAATAAPGQEPESWNDERVLDLVERARAVRQSVAVDPDFRSYRGEARGYVYFFIDRPGSDERTLVKADQIALEVYWQAPNRARQRMVGLRDEKVLPTNIRYHLDHLTVVQDDFGDFIRIGDGDEVEQVLHPIGPRSEKAYDFLLADSLSITYGGGAEEVRVYEVRVRPKEHDAPGVVGSVYVDRANAAIVRMSFTFTPASYVDDYLDYIRISLDNSLWDGRFWLPYRQEVELRREMPALDFLAGSIIRGRFEIGRYEFNVDVPQLMLVGRGVVAVPEEQRRSFPFERGLFADLEEEGLAPSPSMEEIREQASQILQRRYLSGLGPLRLHLGATSDALRYNRAEGLFLGGGFAARPEGDVQLRATGGYAFGREKLSGSLAATGGPGDVVPELRVYWDDLRDVGWRPGAAPVVNTLGTAFGINDYTDPYFTQGASLAFAGRESRAPRLTLRLERQLSATDVVSDAPGTDHRLVRAIESGTMGAIDVELATTLPEDGTAALFGTLGRLGDHTFASLVGEALWRIEAMEDRWYVDVSAAAGAATSNTPIQELFVMGGRETLPGHVYRGFLGDRFWLLHAEATVPLAAPWVSLRAFAATGATYLGDARLPLDWPATDTDGIRASLGLGVALGFDILRLDLGRGLRDGRWELAFSVKPAFRPWL